MILFLQDWASLLIRWLHFIAGVAWVGASFYFIWVESALVRAAKQSSEDIAGHLWAIHGGGIYYLEKYKVAPERLPPQLHWFKWEAYTTWLSGMALMTLVYYLGASAWLIAPDSSITTGPAIVLSLSLLVGSVALYVVLCSTPLLEYPKILGIVGLVIAMAVAWALPAVFTARAAFMHIGAMVGTMMVANVLMVIIPGQKLLVESVKTGVKPDPELVRRGSLRSLHNNYLVLPVLLMMIAGHYPILYETPNAWLTLGAIWIAGIYIRHFFNCRNSGRPSWRWAAVAVAAIALAVATTAPLSVPVSDAEADFADVQRVVALHCTTCHAANPSDDIFRVAPLGFKLDTPESITANAAAIYQRTVVDRSMPFANKTGMTEQERAVIAAWFMQLK